MRNLQLFVLQFSYNNISFFPGCFQDFSFALSFQLIMRFLVYISLGLYCLVFSRLLELQDCVFYQIW